MLTMMEIPSGLPLDKPTGDGMTGGLDHSAVEELNGSLDRRAGNSDGHGVQSYQSWCYVEEQRLVQVQSVSDCLHSMGQRSKAKRKVRAPLESIKPGVQAVHLHGRVQQRVVLHVQHLPRGEFRSVVVLH